MKSRNITQLLFTLLIFTLLVISAGVYANHGVVKLRIMETADIHCHLTNHDYLAEKPNDAVGLVRTATLIKAAQKEAKNSILLENGDLLQGNPMADYAATKLPPTDTHPVYKVMNRLHYDAGNLGNHDFDYGLDYLGNVIKGAAFPYVCANVYTASGNNDTNYFTPYLILDKEVMDEDGQPHRLKVGVIGFVPPEITLWDKAQLQGKVVTRDIYETALKFIPEMKAAGADIIIAVAHSGLGKAEHEDLVGNQTYQLSKIKDINAILFGHTHTTFPGKDYDGIQNLDNQKGTINGTPAVQPGFWGSHLGVIDLSLQQTNGKWTVVDSQSEVRATYDGKSKKPLVDIDSQLYSLLQADHKGTINYVNEPVGKTEAPLYSYFSQVQDDPTIQIVNDAQRWYMQKYIEGTEWDKYPVLSAAAPLRAGVDEVISDYTDIPIGKLAIKDTTALYKYPNTLMAVKLTGREVIEWLEWSAGQFHQIDPQSTKEQYLVRDNKGGGDNSFESYNFDVIDGIQYQIDVTKPQRYDKHGQQIRDSHRIINVMFHNNPINLDQEFIVVANSYRAGSSKFANPDRKRIVIEAPDEIRQILVNYIIEQKSVNPQADRNWSIAPIPNTVNLVFKSSPQAKKYASGHITYLETLENGLAKFKIKFE